MKINYVEVVRCHDALYVGEIEKNEETLLLLFHLGSHEVVGVRNWSCYLDVKAITGMRTIYTVYGRKERKNTHRFRKYYEAALGLSKYNNELIVSNHFP